ncbi:MAG TPA: LPP20 family lipoprotein [Candidatus Ornithospirochaeta avicola]|uniref:LPP20 family lipoprotein n=1 Tax=Candidatus Ornithospirochaeta avicola TaxID=2840896 RepID=A0A9D1TN89_9SPIO|nr:LPP20 family lipoprotein [Candidatus Ornithospirochaeta avicola]
MKKFLVLIIASFLLASCVTETDITAVNDDGSPIWTTEVPQSGKVVYGVGSAKLSNEANSRNAADANARAEMSRKLEVLMNDAVATYANDAEGQALAAYEQLTVQTVGITLRNVKVEQRWTAPDGTVWSLVSVKIKDLDDIYALEANDYKNKLEKDKTELANKYMALLAQIAQSALPEEQAEELKDAAEEYLKIENSRIDEENSQINPDELQAAIREFFASSGYDLD